MATKTFTLAAIAPLADMSPKGARAKFRRMKKERPFDHTKVSILTAAQVKAALAFLKTDYRNQ